LVIVSVAPGGAATVLVVSEELLLDSGSAVVELTVATFVRSVPSLTDGETVVTSENSTVPGANVAVEQVTVPFALAAGVVQFQPALGETD
jgi:hypothetical protein